MEMSNVKIIFCISAEEMDMGISLESIILYSQRTTNQTAMTALAQYIKSFFIMLPPDKARP
ncbi:hypothetical protein BPA01_38620 [Brevibacillus parabrevis]|uniref:Uncharacterized protein n=1 Tax=Brevibacillus parabrevis TaxID=54914 RepID=A0A4Y3PIF3_BREPA|nr:hypothetical protein BPA01_38620 [Brevibacillus parabrevis]